LFLLSFLGDKYPWIDKFPAFNIDLKVAREVSNSYILCDSIYKDLESER